MKILSVLLEITPYLAMRAIKTPLNSPMGTMWCLCDPTPSGWLERLSTGSISTWEDLTTRFLIQFFPPRRTAKFQNDILMFQQHQGESLSKAWTRFKDLLQKVPHHGIDLWLHVQIFYDHVNPATRRTIDQAASGKLRDKNAKESWALLEDLALYDNKSWNNPRDFVKLVKAISLPQDVPSTSDRRLIKLENQVQSLMEAHLAPKLPIQAINDRMTGALPSDTVKNRKLNVKSTSSFLSARSYPMGDPQSLSHPLNLINAIKTCSKQTNDFQLDQLKVKTLPVNKIETPKLKETEQTLEDEFNDLHLNLLVLEVLVHALMYNAILDIYVEILELGKSGSAFIQGKMPEKIKDPGLFTLPCRLGDSKPFDTLADLGSYRTKSYPVGIVKNVEVHIGRTPFALGWQLARDVILNQFKDVLVFRKMVEFLRAIPINLKGNMWESKELIKKKIDWNRPPKEGYGVWHIRIELINPDGEKFKKTFQSIPTTRKLSEKENPSEIIDLDHLHDF
ncbi:MAK10-like protein [Tanacetum coccineum]